MLQNGYHEIVLTGINLSAYGQELGLSLCDAVEAACESDGIARVRLGSLEPEQLDEPTIERLQRQKKLCPQFHLVSAERLRRNAETHEPSLYVRRNTG